MTLKKDNICEFRSVVYSPESKEKMTEVNKHLGSVFVFGILKRGELFDHD